MADLKALAETLVNLSVKDVQELATILKADYGIEPAAAAVAAAPAGGGGAAAAAEKLMRCNSEKRSARKLNIVQNS